nr:uncharacterized protein LOC128687760 [Cherax quadricarinatus]
MSVPVVMTALSHPGVDCNVLIQVYDCIVPPSWFLVSLAVADLLLLLLCVPLETLQYFLWTPHLSLPVCKLSSYCELLSAVASVLNLTAVSLERYIVIVYPMRSRTFCTLSNCRRAIIGVWCVSLVLSVPAGVTQDVYSMTYYNASHSVTVYHCATGGDHGTLFAVYRLVIVFVIPALFMSFFYARVIKALWVSTKKMTAMTRVYSISSHNSLASCSVSSGLVHPSSSATSGLAALHAGCPVKRCVHRQRSGEEVKQARKQVGFQRGCQGKQALFCGGDEGSTRISVKAVKESRYLCRCEGGEEAVATCNFAGHLLIHSERFSVTKIIIIILIHLWNITIDSGSGILLHHIPEMNLIMLMMMTVMMTIMIMMMAESVTETLNSACVSLCHSFMSTNFGRMMRRSCARDNCSSLLNTLCVGTSKKCKHKSDVAGTRAGAALAPPTTPPTAPSEPLYLENGVGFDLPTTSYLDLNGHTSSAANTLRTNTDDNQDSRI